MHITLVRFLLRYLPTPKLDVLYERSLGMLSVMPDLDFQQGGQAPGGSVGPGSPGGGGLPTNTAISTLSLSLALVPLGLLAVAVFPPFSKYVI